MTTGTQSIHPDFVRGVVPALRLSTGAAVSTRDAAPDVLVVPVVSGLSGPEVPVSAPLSEHARIELWKAAVEAGVTGDADGTELLPGGDSVPVPRVLIVGLGPADRITPEAVRLAAGNASRALDRIPVESGPGAGLHALSLLGSVSEFTSPALAPDAVLAAATEGHALGGYRYPGLRTPADESSGHLAVVTVQTPDLPGMPAAFTRACTVVEAVTCARDLVNAPSSTLFPESYAHIITDLALGSGVEVEILDEVDLEIRGFGGITGVGQGSARPPRLVRMHYVPEATSAPHVALVGKGVTFDTGGISLKNPAGMDAMISDMGGSAAVVATVLAAAELELPVEVTATLPLVENMPDGSALRPGDVLHHYNGTTAEIVNTDAEGRLILADALARAAEDGPDLLVDAATLTGAQVRALGDRITAVMGTPVLRDRIVALSVGTGEDSWPMPLPAEIAEDIRSDVADVRNTGTTRWAGMAAAGQYLAGFVPEGLPWAHLDIAGPAYNTGAARGYTPVRGTGAPVRTLISLLEDTVRTS